MSTPVHESVEAHHAIVAHDDSASDHKLSMAIITMVGLLAILFAVVVPISIVLIYRSLGY